MFKRLIDKVQPKAAPATTEGAAETSAAQSSDNLPESVPSSTAVAGHSSTSQRQHSDEGQHSTPARREDAERVLAETSREPTVQEDVVALETSSKDDLIRMYQKRTVQLQKYQSKMGDLAAAYRGALGVKEKLERMLETQQDESLIRIKEIQDSHRRDAESKSKLIETMRTRLLEKDNEIGKQQVELLALQQSLMEKSERIRTLEAQSSQLQTGVGGMDQAMQTLNTQLAVLRTQLDESRSVIAERDRTISDLRSSLTASTDEAKRANDTLETLRASLRRTESEVTELSTQLSSTKNVVQNKERMIEELAVLHTKSEKAAFDSEQAVMQQKLVIQRLELELEALQRQSAALNRSSRAEEQLRQQLEEIQRTCAVVTNERAAAQIEVSRLQNELDSQTKQAKALEQRLTDELKHQAEIIESMQTRSQQAGTLEDEIQVREARINELQARITQLTRESHAAVDKANEDAAVTLKEVTDAKRVLEEERAQLQSCVAQLGSKVAALEGDLADRRADYDALANQKGALDLLLSQTKAEYQAALDANKTLKASLLDTEAEVKSLQLKMANKDSLLADLTQQLEAARNKVNFLTQQATDEDTQLSLKTTRIQQLESSINTMQGELSDAKLATDRLEERLSESERAKQLFQDEVQTTTAKLQDTTSRCAELEQQLEAARDETKSTRSQLDATASTTQQLQASLEQTTATLTAVQGEAQTLREANFASEKTVRQLQTKINELQSQVADQSATIARSAKMIQTFVQEKEEAERRVRTELESKMQTSEQAWKAKETQLQDENETLAQQVTQLNAALGVLAEIETDRDQLNAQVFQLQREIEALQSTQAQLEREREALLVEKDAEAAASEGFRAEIAFYVESLNKNEAEIAKLKDEAEQAHKLADSSTSEIAQLKVKLDAALDQIGLHEREIKRHQLQAADLKKTLQRELRSQTASSNNLQDEPAQLVLQQDSVPSMRSPPTGPSGAQTPADTRRLTGQRTSVEDLASHDVPLDPSPHTPHKSLNTSTTNGTPRIIDMHGDEVVDLSFEYLKHVILKYMSRPAEAKQLLKVISTLLHFTTEEENRVKLALSSGWSWF